MSYNTSIGCRSGADKEVRTMGGTGAGGGGGI